MERRALVFSAGRGAESHCGEAQGCAAGRDGSHGGGGCQVVRRDSESQGFRGGRVPSGFAAGIFSTATKPCCKVRVFPLNKVLSYPDKSLP